MKYKSIIISGQIASGTTTAAKNVSEKLNLKFKSAGDFFRDYVLKNNIPLYDKEQIPDSLDRQIDEKLTNLASSGGYVIDSHYLGFFTKDNPEILKVLLTCKDEVRLKRATDRTHTHEETTDEIKKREEGLDKKFRKLYSKENYLNPEFFDLTIDTTNVSETEVSQKIIEKFES